MRVLGYDPYISEAAAREFQVELVPLEKLLAESDFISLHTALSPATQNLINAATLAKMKKGARIINAARGELIDEAALAEALKSGTSGRRGAGRICGRAAEEFAAGGLAERDRHAAHRGFDDGSAGRSGHAGGGAGADYLADGIIRNAVNLPALSAEQYRRVRPYLALAERLGSLVSQAAATRPARIRIRYAGEVAEVGTHLLRSAVLAGVLNAVLDEKVNVVNAPAVATGAD